MNEKEKAALFAWFVAQIAIAEKAKTNLEAHQGKVRWSVVGWSLPYHTGRLEGYEAALAEFKRILREC